MGIGPPDGPDDFEVTPALLWVLADEYNRYVIRYFHDSGAAEATLDEIARFVARHHDRYERGEPEEAAVRLHHRSLPALAEKGLIEYDPQRQEVRPRRDQILPAELLQHVLGLDDDTD